MKDTIIVPSQIVVIKKVKPIKNIQLECLIMLDAIKKIIKAFVP